MKLQNINPRPIFILIQPEEHCHSKFAQYNFAWSVCSCNLTFYTKNFVTLENTGQLHLHVFIPKPQHFTTLKCILNVLSFVNDIPGDSFHVKHVLTHNTSTSSWTHRYRSMLRNTAKELLTISLILTSKGSTSRKKRYTTVYGS